MAIRLLYSELLRTLKINKELTADPKTHQKRISTINNQFTYLQHYHIIYLVFKNLKDTIIHYIK